MKVLLQLFIGIVIGVMTLKSLSEWLRSADSSMTDDRSRHDLQHLNVDKITSEDIEGGVKLHKKFAEFLKDPVNPQGELQIKKVTDGVYVSQGYSFVNIVFIEGPEGLIVVDTGESLESAKAVLSAWRQSNNTPIKAIILTHHHTDHISGLDIFIEDKTNPPDIWSYYALPEIIRSFVAVGQKAWRGANHQFGLKLSDKFEGRWPRLPHKMTSGKLARQPNRLIRNEVEHVQIAGLNVTFLHVPGETEDQLTVWLPDKRVSIIGDNLYKAFPNLFAIRGVPPRDCRDWMRSVRLMRSLDAEYMVPLHGLPISGRQDIYDLLSVYSSAIQLVHDQTVRRINELRHPDEIARLVQLPPSLASHPYLGEFYGTVAASAKDIYHQYVGWFSGDPADLTPLTPSERAQSMIDWLGIDRILDEAESALRSGRTQWSLELSAQVRRVRPEHLRARWLWTQSLRQSASEQYNAPIRNYFLTAALNGNGLIDWNMNRVVTNVDDIGIPLGLMKYRLKAELTDRVNRSIHLHFTDTGSTYRLQVLYSVLQVDLMSSDTVIDEYVDTIHTTVPVWLDILLGNTSAATAYSQGQVKVTGSVQDVRQFMSYF